MGWLLVTFAAISEFVAVIGLKKYSMQKSLINFVLYAGGFGLALLCLYLSFNFLQVSTAYAVWIGVGTAGAVIINMIYFGESRSIGRICSVGLIIIGVVGLKAIT
ncbi:DMT family transporter [Ureibacillus manganicus]|uniref:Multidrug resistance protein SMR n=1 Tax=Ureibacillus manganicus DSM 26584 TaxID=1384049 RepID=A0A0A3I2L4_9BACL|nr:SMR family transporter [Ureibacillus manganicus]KGR79066.1 multidrug resistance protein SMR [Ureibacillus manganicus DSM 26584]